VARAKSIRNKRELEHAVSELARIDDRIAGISARVRPLTFVRGERGFAALAEIVVSQQLSSAAADTIFGRLKQCIDPFDPATLLSTSDQTLRTAGLSAPKQRHLRAIAARIVSGELDLSCLSGLGDEEARAHLVETPGIGPWTADIYLMFSLMRADIWPVGDVALVAAVTSALGLRKRPDAKAMTRLGEPYRPWRTIAARFFWAEYRRVQQEAKARAVAAAQRKRDAKEKTPARDHASIPSAKALN
jgi:DNA-3-methyladenine glycosylase II